MSNGRFACQKKWWMEVNGESTGKRLANQRTMETWWPRSKKFWTSLLQQIAMAWVKVTKKPLLCMQFSLNATDQVLLNSPTIINWRNGKLARKLAFTAPLLKWINDRRYFAKHFQHIQIYERRDRHKFLNLVMKAWHDTLSFTLSWRVGLTT